MKRNAEWLNYIWYNQQQFINYTLQGIEKQLHAVPLMTLQNQLAIDSMRAPDCLIGEECCMVISMHTGEGSNLIFAIKALENLHNEHVWNSHKPDPE